MLPVYDHHCVSYTTFGACNQSQLYNPISSFRIPPNTISEALHGLCALMHASNYSQVEPSGDAMQCFTLLEGCPAIKHENCKKCTDTYPKYSQMKASGDDTMQCFTLAEGCRAMYHYVLTITHAHIPQILTD